MKEKEIKIKGFTTNPQPDDALAIAVFGEQGSGKTRFCTTAPDPIGFIPLDRKARKTVHKVAKEMGKVVLMPEDDFIRVAKPMELAVMGTEDAKKYYRKHVNAIKEAAFTLYAHPLIRTICIDTGTQLWEDILFANFGRAERIMPRDRGSANQEMIDFLNALSGKNLIITHKAREIWKNDKPSGKFECAGFSHIGYHVNVLCECVCDDKKEAGEEGRFNLSVHLCQDNPDIQGPGGKNLLSDDQITFQYLAMQMFPEDDMERWM